MEFKIATISDIKILSEIRIEVLKAANKLDEVVELNGVKKETEDYYTKAFSEKSNVTCFVYDNGEFVGCGSISYYSVMPTYSNPTGKKAYIMNMYTREKDRRKGVVTNILDLLINDAHNKNVKCILLEATDIGRKLYEKYGFKQMKDEMEYL